MYGDKKRVRVTRAAGARDIDVLRMFIGSVGLVVGIGREVDDGIDGLCVELFVLAVDDPRTLRVTSALVVEFVVGETMTFPSGPITELSTSDSELAFSIYFVSK